MKKSGPRRALVFAAQFAILLAIFLGLYPLILPPYQQALIRCANLVLEQLSPVLQLATGEGGGWVTFWITPLGRLLPVHEMSRSAVDMVFLNLALLPALLLATPVSLARRLRLLAWGAGLLLVFHVFAAVGLVRTHYCLSTDPGNALCGWVRGNLKISGQLFAVVLWALLTWSHWLPRRVSPAAPLEPRPGS